MLEIKFRAWDGRNIRTDFYLDSKEMIVMQFTGFIDRHGKEIYEGDIVRCYDGAGEISEDDSDTGIGYIEWLDDHGFWNISKIENGLGDILQNGYIEIIGNIYENPNLLAE